MNETRRKIIIQEIKYWKKTNLLPEQYCAFLLTLYSEGEEDISKIKTKKFTSFHVPLWILTILFFGTLFVNYFTEISTGLQITLTAIVILALSFFTYRFIDSVLLSQLAIVAVALLFLVETVNIIGVIFPKQPGVLYAALFIQCIIWFFLGKRLKLIYFSISGIVGTFILIFFLAKQLM